MSELSFCARAFACASFARCMRSLIAATVAASVTVEVPAVPVTFWTAGLRAMLSRTPDTTFDRSSRPVTVARRKASTPTVMRRSAPGPFEGALVGGTVWGVEGIGDADWLSSMSIASALAVRAG